MSERPASINSAGVDAFGDIYGGDAKQMTVKLRDAHGKGSLRDVEFVKKSRNPRDPGGKVQ